MSNTNKYNVKLTTAIEKINEWISFSFIDSAITECFQTLVKLLVEVFVNVWCFYLFLILH